MIFRVNFTLKNGCQTVSGQTDNRFRISAASGSENHFDRRKAGPIMTSAVATRVASLGASK